MNTTPVTQASQQIAFNQYEILNAGFAIDGYFMPRPLESSETVFNRAKDEALKHLRRSIECVASATFTQFKASGFQPY